jgi:hypothetical protein
MLSLFTGIETPPTGAGVTWLTVLSTGSKIDFAAKDFPYSASRSYHRVSFTQTVEGDDYPYGVSAEGVARSCKSILHTKTKVANTLIENSPSTFFNEILMRNIFDQCWIPKDFQGKLPHRPCETTYGDLDVEVAGDRYVYDLRL